MSDLICKKTMMRCHTPGMCSPHGGCQSEKGFEDSHIDLGKFVDWVWALKGERDQLKAENEALKHQISAGAAREWDLRSQVKAARESRARVVKSNQTLRKDAYRYNWFRDCGNDWHEVIVIDSHGRIICDEVDDAIDAAMSAGK